MSPAALLPYLPHGALALGVVVVLVVLHRAVTRAKLHRRPILLVATLLAVAPALYMGLVWLRLLPEAYLRLGRPLLSLLAFPVMALVAHRLAQHTTRWSRLRQVLADAAIAVAVLACALAATSPELGRPLDRLTVIVVVDRSRSIDLVPQAEQRVARELSFAEQSMQDDDLIGIVVFGAAAATEEPPRPKSEIQSVQRVDVGRDGTDIATGLRRALAEVPADSAARLVLMSDGVPTRGDVMAAAAAAVASEIPIDVVPLDQREVADVRVVSFRVTPRATEGETINMRLVVASPADTTIEVRIKRDGKIVRRAKAQVAAGEDVLRIREPAPTSGLHRYDVEISALDQRLDETADDNQASSFIRVRGPARALVLDGDAGQTRFIAGALEAAGFRVDQGTTSSVPTDIDGMAAYDVIAMGDIPAPDLAPRQIEALASYVRDLGGGLLLTGGDRSMGPGGYSKTAVEAVSPVSFDLKQERRRASLAEVIAIDISGSMAAHVGGQTKLELANEAAARSANLLGSGDHLGVEHVDTAVKWSVPLGPVTDPKAIEAAIRAVSPGGGGIYVNVALQEAYAALGRAKVNLKHVLLFADGGDAEMITPAVQASVSSAQAHGITTSCVALGRGGDVAALEEMSKRGGGRFYIVEDATRLPAVFAQETILASRSAVVEKTFAVATAASTAITKGIDFDAAPALDGYVVTIPKGRSTVLLTGPDADPILAVWSAGIGRAAAFTSDLKDRWGGEWTHWEGAARMVAQAARDVSRSEDDGRVRLEADTAGGQLHLRAVVVDDDGRMQSFRRLQATVRGPDGFGRDVALEAAGAGTYTATVPLSRPGAYIAVARDEISGKPVATTGAALTAGEELRPTGTDVALLRRIAELTGGKKRDTLAGIFADRAARRFAYRDITAHLLLVAAFALLLAVAARRLSIPPAAYAWVGRALRWRPWSRRPEGPPAPGGATAQATLESLMKSKQESAEQRRRQADEVHLPAAADAPVAGPAGVPPGASPAAPAPAEASPAASAAEQLAAQRGARGARAWGAAQPGPSPAWQQPSATPSQPRRQPQAAAAPITRPGQQPPRPATPIITGDGPPSSRPLTAAEILLQRRKGKRR